jgi:hypothetical protein
MPEGWLRVDVVIVVLLVVLAASLGGMYLMMTSEPDFDTLMEGPAICWLPVSVMFTILSLALLANHVPHRGSGRRAFEVGLEDAEARIEAYLRSQGLRFERDERVEQVRRTRDHSDVYSLTLEGRAAAVLVRGREEGASVLVFVSPWPLDPAFVDGLEAAILHPR